MLFDNRILGLDWRASGSGFCTKASFYSPDSSYDSISLDNISRATQHIATPLQSRISLHISDLTSEVADVIMNRSGSKSQKDDKDAGKLSISKIIAAYQNCLSSNPLLTKCCTSAFSAGLGDIIAQLVLNKGRYDSTRRTLAFTAFGFFCTGPIMHRFYSFLARTFPSQMKNAVVYRLATDRLVLSPIFLLLFFILVPILQGKNLSEVSEMLSRTYWPALQANWKAWTLVQLINLKYVPSEHQTLFANGFALLWNIYLSFQQK